MHFSVFAITDVQISLQNNLEVKVDSKAIFVKGKTMQ